MGKRPTDRMPDTSFQVMELLFVIADLIYPHVRRRARSFDIQEGMIVVDYGCGPGRYTTEFARIVGESGKVYAIDIHELAIEAVRKKIAKRGIHKVEALLAHGYNCGLPDAVADVVCAIDMFFGVREPIVFLEELKRITNADGLLVIDDGHQSRAKTKEKMLASGCWRIIEENRDHLKCKMV